MDSKGILKWSLRNPNALVTVAYDSPVKRIVGRTYDRCLRHDIVPIIDLYFVVAITNFIGRETAITD